MSKRADKTKDLELDTERTDQLPALDVAGFEAARGGSNDDLNSTGTWAAPAAAAVAGSESAQIFDTIRTLEANLHAKSERTAQPGRAPRARRARARSGGAARAGARAGVVAR